ncbi:tripartite tricarboxylate transporter substrate binding protein [Alcaligenaceae bacterium CGII-47]|nr:tripartite tricarboxylate transporter substrate binding protein [Alcaligenaceae bacterium CGII-47]
MNAIRRALCALAAVAMSASLIQPALAKEWPDRQPIRIIVPYAVGGNADSAARLIGDVIAKTLKQSVIVENRPGASSIIGTNAIARAPADGYTIGVVSDSHAINQVISTLPKSGDVVGAKVPYDAVRDFAPVAGMIEVPLVLVTSTKVPANSVKELVAFSQQGSGINFATIGPGSPWFVHMHQLNHLTQSNFISIPYGGLGSMLNDIFSGEIDALVMPVHVATQFIQARKMKALATLGSQRHPLLPNVPTLAEAGYPGLTIVNRLFFVAPAGTPQPIVDRLSEAINAALRQPGMREKLLTSGDPYLTTPTELAADLLRDIETYGAVIQANVK